MCAALAVLAAIALGAAGRATGGFEDLIVKYRMNADQRAFYALVRQNRLADQRIINPAAAPCYMRVESRADIDAEKINACRAEYGQALLILGDSHAMDLSRIIAETGVFPFLIDTAVPACQPPRGVEFCGWGSVDALVRDFGGAAGAVFFHQSGSRFIEDKNGRVDSQAAFEGAYGGVRLSDIKSLMTWLEDLRRKFAAPVVWVGPFAEYRYMPFAAVYNPDKRRFNPASKPLFRELELEIEKAAAAAGFEIYAGFEKLFTVPETVLAEDCFMFDDEDHFSACGERIIARTETGRLRAFRDKLGVFPPHP